MWKTSIAALNKYVADPTPSGLWYAQVNMNTGAKRLDPLRRAGRILPCGAGALRRSGSRRAIAGVELQDVDDLRHRAGRVGLLHDEDHYPGYELRPEIIESTYYLYYFTGKPRYLDMGKTFADSLDKYCRTDAGFAALLNVETKQQRDDMESFFLAETLKYLYLLYAPKSTLDLHKVGLQHRGASNPENVVGRFSTSNVLQVNMALGAQQNTTTLSRSRHRAELHADRWQW